MAAAVSLGKSGIGPSNDGAVPGRKSHLFWATGFARRAKGGLVGHGGIVVFDDTVDLAQMARYAMEFCAIESCGKCTPCRIGSTRGVEVIDRIIRNEDRAANAELLRDLCDTMQSGSLCALGGLTPLPVRSALTHFPGDFGLATS